MTEPLLRVSHLVKNFPARGTLLLGGAGYALQGSPGIPGAPAQGEGGRDIFPLLTVKENLETGFAVLPRGQRKIPEEIFDLFVKSLAELRQPADPLELPGR